MTQLYKASLLPHLYRRLAFGQAIWNRTGRIDFAGATRAHGIMPGCHTKKFVSSISHSGWCSHSHSPRLIAVPLFVVFLLLLSGGSVCGQVVSGTLTGIVTDSTGATIPNAKVIITELSTNSE